MKPATYLTLTAIAQTVYSVSVYNGSTISFNCSLTLPSSDALFWHFEQQNNERTVGIDDQKKGTFASDMRYSLATVNNITTLTIYGVAMEDEGTYRCSSFLGHGMDQWSLEVYSLPSKPSIHQHAGTTEGQLYIVECLAYGGKPVPAFSWQMTDSRGDEIDITYASKESFPSLSNNGTGKSLAKLGVVLTRRMQGGRIFCTAYQPNLEEYYSEGVEATIDQGLFSPFLPRVSAPNETLIQGHNYTFQCLVDGANPAANITWSVMLPSGEQRVVDESTQEERDAGAHFITIGEVDLEASIDLDQSELKCSASNSISDRKGEVVFSTSISLLVNYAPVVKLADERGVAVTSLHVGVGQRLTLHCETVDANPQVTTNTWMFNGVDSSKHQIECNESSLTIANVSRSDEGQWQCAGINAVGAGISQQFFLHVLYKPSCALDVQTKHTGRPGEPVDLVCRAEAKPGHVVFKWKKSGVEIEAMTETRKMGAYVSESVLRVVPRNQSDYGHYECYAENTQGSLDSPCVLELALSGPAESPQGCRVWAMSLTSLSIECEKETAITYSLKMLRNGRYVPLANDTVPTFNITSLSENSSYSFIVCASIYENWAEEMCTSPLIGTTAKRYVLSFTSPMPNNLDLSPDILYIIIAVGCGLMVCVVVVVTSVACHMQRNRKSHRSNLKMRDEALQF